MTLKLSSCPKFIAQIGLVFLSISFSGCATTSAPIGDMGSVWGYVTLKAREGVTLNQASGSGYEDRRLKDVEFVDYSKPGFVVIYLEHVSPPENDAVSVIFRETRFGSRFDSKYGVVGIGGKIIIENADKVGHTFSCPQIGFLKYLDSGSKAEINPKRSGELRFHVIDSIDKEALIFVSPGQYAISSDVGRWELKNITPGQHRLNAWHPRFPPVSSFIEIKKNSKLRNDIVIGVDSLRMENSNALIK